MSGCPSRDEAVYPHKDARCDRSPVGHAIESGSWFTDLRASRVGRSRKAYEVFMTSKNVRAGQLATLLDDGGKWRQLEIDATPQTEDICELVHSPMEALELRS
jgi:hypothetical protein